MGRIKRCGLASLVGAGLSLWVVAVALAQQPAQQHPVTDASVNRPVDGETSSSEPSVAQTLPTSRDKGPIVPDKRSEDGDIAPITLHLDDVDVRKALELLSREGSLNILVSPNVTGRVTANLQDLTVDQALDAILKLCNLAAKREQRLIYVYTPDEISQAAQKDRKTSVRVYRLNYVKSTDLQNMITPFLSENGHLVSTPPSEIGIKADTQHAGGDSLAGGDVVVVQDDETTLKIIDDIVFKLDVQPVQVLIEAVIITVELVKGKELGVNFAVLDGAGRVLNVVGNGVEINAAAGFTPSEVLTAGGKVMDPFIKAGFAADTHGIKFGFVDKDVTGFIRALERVGETNVLAAPRLLVLNKQRAEIQLGRRLGYKTLTVTETASVEKVEFLNTGTQLRLRPFVSADGTIRMEIHPERSSGFIDAKGVPQASTSEVTTNVLVPDGSTIVIGGLMDSEDNTEQSGVPGLSRLRWVGGLFRQKQQSSTKKELIVLLTPHIWNPVGLQGPSGDIAQTSLVQTSKQERRPSERPLRPIEMMIHEQTDPVQVGQEIVYEIEVVNRGQKTMQGIVLSASFTPGLHPIHANGPAEGLITEHKVIYNLVDCLEPQRQTVYFIRAKATRSGAQRISARLYSLSLPDGLTVEKDTAVMANRDERPETSAARLVTPGR